LKVDFFCLFLKGYSDFGTQNSLTFNGICDHERLMTFWKSHPRSLLWLCCSCS